MFKNLQFYQKVIVLLWLGFSAGELLAAVDITPPKILSIDFNPKTVDVSNADQIVTVTVRATDDISGINLIFAGGFSSSTTTQAENGGFQQFFSGTEKDGIWKNEVTIKAHSAPGIWIFNPPSGLNDKAGNFQSYTRETLGIQNDLTVISSNSDTTPPKILSIDFNPKTVDVSNADQIVTVTVRATDDISGINLIFAGGFSSSTTTQAENGGFQQFFSGTEKDGIWKNEVTIKAHSAPGIWIFNPPSGLNDKAGNFQSYTRETLGIQTDLTVISNNSKQFNLTLNKIGNGQISSGGSFTNGSTVNLSATPDAGYVFNGWLPTPCNSSFQMPANDLTCTATFSPIPVNDSNLSFKSERCPISQLDPFKSCYEESSFPIGSKLKITLNSKIITNRYQRFDLWVAIQLPSGDFLFMTPQPFNRFKFMDSRYNGEAFMPNIEAAERTDTIFEFDVPLNFGGKYTFYALYVALGKNPLLHGESVWLSNLAMKEITLASK